MKCMNCGADIPEGMLICPDCGTEVQIVPDYNLFEEDVLTHILENNSQSDQNKTTQRQNSLMGPITSLFG